MKKDITWEYRLVREWDESFGGALLRVCEVYFQEGVDKPISYAHTALGSAEFKEEIEKDIRRIEYALDAPILDAYQDFAVANPNITHEGE